MRENDPNLQKCDQYGEITERDKVPDAIPNTFEERQVFPGGEGLSALTSKDEEHEYRQ